MRAIRWFLKPPPWFLGATALVGAMWFIGVTFVASPFMRPAEKTIDYDLLGRTIIIGAVLLVVPITRGFGLGFFAAFVLGSFNNDLGTRVWWQPFRTWYADAMQPSRDKQKKREATEAWMQAHRDSLELRHAVFLLEKIQSNCLSRSHPPNIDELLTEPSCSPYGRITLREKLEWPARYIQGDDGWRWSYESLGDSNYRVIIRPDSVLKHKGPEIEMMIDGVARIRNNDQSEWHTVYTPVPTLRRVRECVLNAAAMAETENNKTAKFEFLYYGYYAEHACPEWRMNASTTRGNGDHVVEIKQWSRRPGDLPFVALVLYRVVGERRFEVRKETLTRNYLLDADGGLHVTAERRPAEVTDPPPARCEEDSAIPCT